MQEDDRVIVRRESAFVFCWPRMSLVSDRTIGNDCWFSVVDDGIDRSFSFDTALGSNGYIPALAKPPWQWDFNRLFSHKSFIYVKEKSSIVKD